MILNKDSLLNPRLLFICYCVLLAGLFAKDVYLSTAYPLADLRNRVVGARAYNQDLPPYTYKWQPGNDITLLNPYDFYSSTYSLYTGTPAFSLVIAPLSLLTYTHIKLIWTTISFLCIAFILLKLFLKKAIPNKQRLLVCIFSTLFLFTNNWQQSVIQGQYYFLFPFLLLLAYQITLTNKKNLAAFIILVGLISLLRPLLIIVLLPLIINSKFYLSILKGALITGAIVGLYLLITKDFNSWKQYSASSAHWVNYYKKSNDSLKNTPQINEYWSARGMILQEENGVSNKSNTKSDSAKIGSQVTNVTHVTKTLTGLSLPLNVCFYAWVAISGFIMLFLKHKKRTTIEDCLFAGYIIYYLLEIFLPIPRHSYYFPEMLFPISMLWMGNKINIYDMAIICLCLLIMCIPVKIFPLQLVVTEFLLITKLIHCFLRSKTTSKSIQELRA